MYNNDVLYWITSHLREQQGFSTNNPLEVGKVFQSGTKLIQTRSTGEHFRCGTESQAKPKRTKGEIKEVNKSGVSLHTTLGLRTKLVYLQWGLLNVKAMSGSDFYGYDGKTEEPERWVTTEPSARCFSFSGEASLLSAILPSLLPPLFSSSDHKQN